MRAAPDGYTIEMGQMGTHATAVALYPKLAYNPDIDFAPIGLVNWSPVMIVARKDFPPKDINEFVRYVKANSQNLNLAHAGVGGISFACSLLFNSIIGVKPTLLPPIQVRSATVQHRRHGGVNGRGKGRGQGL
jgi:tripartite-type tricarboxylate transporter receptor subunit TctC